MIRMRTAFKNDNFLTVVDCDFSNAKSSNLMCEQFHEITIIYEDFNFYLEDVRKQYPLAQIDVENIIYSVCSALIFMDSNRIHHGDISPKMICRKGSDWKLIDNYFIKGGISAYEKVLEGEEGFISPFQMDKIRHGFVR
jgi:hypothetical protein